MYKVFWVNPSSPEDLEKWLNRIYAKNNWKLVAVDNGYYIFEIQKDDVITE